MTPEHPEQTASASAPARQYPSAGSLWWPGIALALLTLGVATPGLAADRQQLAITCTTAIGFLLAGVPRLGPLVPFTTMVIVLGELIWFERFDDSPGAALATALAAGAAALGSLLLANRARLVVSTTAEAVAELETVRRVSRVQDELSDSHEISQIDVDIMRSRRYGRPLSVVMTQIDNIDLIQQRLGDDAVEAAQVQLARLVVRHSRLADSRIARGSTIVLGLPETEPTGARILAERIRLSFGAERIIGIDDVPLTVSIGISSFPHDGEEGKSVIRHARNAMLNAAAAGGNRTQLHSSVTR